MTARRSQRRLRTGKEGQPCDDTCQVSSLVQLDVGIRADVVEAETVGQQLGEEPHVLLHLPGAHGCRVAAQHPAAGHHHGSSRMAPAKKGGENKGHSAINEVVTREYTINIHKHIHGMGFKKCASWALKETRKFAMKEMRTQMPFDVSAYGQGTQITRQGFSQFTAVTETISLLVGFSLRCNT
ncbi:hypothetical protein GH733_003091 [Mirounga leonina]|nr:hypothetical protein GH733_003091 [Mirounga leonina]